MLRRDDSIDFARKIMAQSDSRGCCEITTPSATKTPNDPMRLKGVVVRLQGVINFSQPSVTNSHCRECLASFETAKKKLHHCHGTGQYLGALCHSCNIAAQTPKTIPVVFHNGGATTSTSCCATLPRWALLSAGTARRARRGQRQRGHRERVLCNSGEKCLQMSWGPLRFVEV